MKLELTKKQYRRLLDMVYIGNWVLNSTRGEDRFAVYDDLESKLFALARDKGMKVLAQDWENTVIPSQAYTEGGIHEAIAYYEDNIFYQILDYCKAHFADEYGEWYGYLRRDGKPTLPACKGSTFKGPFHVPRCLIYVDQMMTQILGE